MIDSYEKVFGSKERIMIVLAHPDDAELYAGGTIRRLILDGKQVRSVKMTSGEKGSRQSVVSESMLKKIREDEDRASMKILGVRDENTIYLDLGDGKIENSLEVISRVVEQIREFKPDIIITHNPEDVIIRFSKCESWVNHRDHMNTALVTTYAMYPFSRDVNFFPEHFENKKLSSHTVTELLYVDSYGHPDEVGIDITDYMEDRIKAHASHESQYSEDEAREFAEFLTSVEGTSKKYERFRHVAVD